MEALDRLEMEMIDKEGLFTPLQNILSLLNRMSTLPADFGPVATMQQWVTTVNQMSISAQLTEDQKRQLKLDLSEAQRTLQEFLQRSDSNRVGGGGGGPSSGRPLAPPASSAAGGHRPAPISSHGGASSRDSGVLAGALGTSPRPAPSATSTSVPATGAGAGAGTGAASAAPAQTFGAGGMGTGGTGPSRPLFHGF